MRSGSVDTDEDGLLSIRCFYSSCLVEIKNDYHRGASAYKGKPGKNEFGKKLQSIANDAYNDSQKSLSVPGLTAKLSELSTGLKSIASKRYDSFTNDSGEFIEYYNDFEKADIENAVIFIELFLSKIGGPILYKGPDQDSPVYFKDTDLPNHLERLAQEQNVSLYLDFLIMRIRTMLSDTRMSSIIGTETDISLTEWLEKYVGKNNAKNGEITVVDLSLVPPDIIHIVVAVMARIIFEAIQRYKRKYAKLLPTVLVMEEAHNFISRYNTDNEEFSPARLCSQSFEKIAKEGRKFGLGLLISSQRPSELSPTVLSQCNTFLLHRLVNDRDQELVKRFVPDNLGSILNELPVLPTKKAILLGWAAPVPILVDMNELKKEYRPDSKDPDFWDVWTGKKVREIDWKKIADEWQKEGDNEDK